MLARGRGQSIDTRRSEIATVDAELTRLTGALAPSIGSAGNYGKGDSRAG
jgi:hypothetical protein